MQKPIKVDLTDPNNPDTNKFFNLLDPLLWTTFIARVKSTSNKKSLEELFNELLEGR